jgi:hypothetical protein
MALEIYDYWVKKDEKPTGSRGIRDHWAGATIPRGPCGHCREIRRSTQAGDSAVAME